MQIRPRADMSREEAIMMLEVERAENEQLRADLARQERLMQAYGRKHKFDVQVLEAEIATLQRQLEAIGAGGVSAQRISGGQL